MTNERKSKQKEHEPCDGCGESQCLCPQTPDEFEAFMQARAERLGPVGHA